MGRNVSAKDAFLIALRYQQGGDTTKAASIYRQLLEDPGTRQWFSEQQMLLTVYNNLIHSLHESGDLAQSLVVFSEAVRAIDRHDDAWFDERYMEGLRRTRSCPVPFGRRHRFRKLTELLRETRGVAGGVVECGCFRGLSSYLICAELRRENDAFTGAGYHVVDSFAGLSGPTSNDSIPDATEDADGLRRMTRAGHFAATIDVVRGTLAEFRDVQYHAGWIPGPFATLPDQAYRFVHVDVDLYEPTLASLEYFYPRLSPGGCIVSDDYGWPGARKAIGEFFGARGVSFEVTPHAQAYVMTLRRGASAG